MESKEFFYEIGKLIYQIDNCYEEYGKKSSVNSPNLLWILYALNDGKMHTQKSVCDEWQIPRSTANTIIKELEEKGFVELNHLEGTRREKLIFLTDEGKKYAEKVLSNLYKKENKIFKEIKDPTKIIQDLQGFLQKLEILGED